MGENAFNRLMARLVAVFFGVAGLIVLGNVWLVPSLVVDPRVMSAVGVGALGVGIAGWLAPWHRWPRGALFVWVPLALALKAAGSFASGANPWTYAVHYVVLYMWIGLALPPWAWLASIPLFLVAYATPAVLLERPEALQTLATVASACLFVGGGASWLTGRLRRAEQESERRAARMSRLVDATLALASSQEIEELASLTSLGAIDVYAGTGALVLLDDGSLLRLVGASGWPGDAEAALAPDCAVAIRRWMLRHDADEAALGRTGWLARRLGVPAIEALALEGSKGPVGVALVALGASHGAPDKFTAYVGRTLATQAGLGFERVLSAQALLDDSLRDVLTGIGNRRKAESALELLKEGDVVALIDLDHFKRVNDSFGHAAGDRVLRALADFLRNASRGPDEVFRWGGEEFLLILHGGRGRADGLTALRRIHRAWNNQRRVTTFSAGIATHGSGDTTETTLARADAALYEAKRSGRDLVVAHGGDGLAAPAADVELY